METLNLTAMGRVQQWATQQPALLAQEVAEMVEHFPHWQPAAYSGKGLLTCRCGGRLSFAAAPDEGLRCEACGKVRKVAPHQGLQLAWVGYLPTLLPERVAKLVAKRLHPSHILSEVGGKRWLLAPILLRYPDNWPQAAPTVQYDPHLLKMLNLSIGAQIHTVGDHVLCLYSYNEWREVTARVVLQQRVVNHLAALVRVANGQAANDAFIGPAHRHDTDYGYWDR